jgi:hypothetical protein
MQEPDNPLPEKASIQEPDNCYRFEFIQYDTGLFDVVLEDSIEATYVIHLEGNGRLERVMEQLKTFQPTKHVYILHNKGYKKCTKPSFIDKPPLDLVDANLHIFRHAKENGYGNILVLEDDFMFDTQILQPQHRDEISGFLSQHKKEDFFYLLGCVPIIMIPVDYQARHFHVIGMVMHSVVYSRTHREKLLDAKQAQIGDWDIYQLLDTGKYCYYKPLCYQLFPVTENQKTWAADYPLLTPFIPLAVGIIKMLKMDTQAEPGYSYFYTFSKIMCWLLILGVIGISVWIIRLLFLFVGACFLPQWFGANGNGAKARISCKKK